MRIPALVPHCGLVLSILSSPVFASKETYDASHLEAQKSQIADRIHRARSLSSTDFSKCATFAERIYPWSQNLGDGNFGVFIEADSHAIANCQGVEVGAHARADATVFEESVSLLDASITASAGKKDISFYSKLLVLGYEVGKNSMSTKAFLQASGRPSYNIDKNEHWDGSIGPVPVTINYGIIGEAHLGWHVTANILEAKIDARPSVDVDAVISGGIGSSSVVALEVGGKMKVLQDDFVAEMGANISGEDHAPEFVTNANIENDMVALSGLLEGQATVASNKIFEKEFFRWEGIDLSESIYKEEKHFPIQLTF